MSSYSFQVPPVLIILPVVFVVVAASAITYTCIKVRRNKERLNHMTVAPQAQGPITSMNPYAAYEPQQQQQLQALQSPQPQQAIQMQPDSNLYYLPRAPSPAHSHADTTSLIQEREQEQEQEREQEPELVSSYPPPSYHV